MNHIYVILYYIWKFISNFIYNEIFFITINVPIQYLLGKYYQIMQTPNSFQKTGLASANYYLSRNKENNPIIRLTNQEYNIMNNKKLNLVDSISGQLEETKVDPGTFFVSFDNMFNVGLYRILDFEIHPQYGTYLFVSSMSPNYSWLLWKPPMDKSNLKNSYNYALSKVKLFMDIGVNPNDLIIVSPENLYKMLIYQE
jgi:lipocalin